MLFFSFASYFIPFSFFCPFSFSCYPFFLLFPFPFFTFPFFLFSSFFLPPFLHLVLFPLFFLPPTFPSSFLLPTCFLSSSPFFFFQLSVFVVGLHAYVSRLFHTELDVSLPLRNVSLNASLDLHYLHANHSLIAKALARIWGEVLAIHSLPALFFFFFKWRSALARQFVFFCFVFLGGAKISP